MNTHRDWKSYIEEIPDFPKEGISFKDISPLLKDQGAFRSAIVSMGDLTIGENKPPDVWIGIDARGFLFAGALACYFGGGVVMCRKKGKLPPPTINTEYNTEYSYDFISIKEGSGSAIIVDDVLATGGTLEATNRVAGLAGYDVIDNVVLIDLNYVPRIDNFDIDVKSVVSYE
jgi:adenine phosphoribosyltransferase